MKNETKVKCAANIQKCVSCGHKADDHSGGTGVCVDCFGPEVGMTACQAFQAPKGSRVVVAQVWHVKDLVTPEDRSLSSQIGWGMCPIDFPKNHDLIAEVNIMAEAKDIPAGVLEEAFRLTNHIDSNWTENWEVTLLGGVARRRSTSMGDVVTIVDVPYVCAPVGWQEVVSADQKVVRGAL